VKILYVVGYGRSGSTILDNVLNELDGFFSVGELRFLWERILQDRWCGCGAAFDSCPVWSRVLGGLAETLTNELDVRTLAADQRAAMGSKRTWQILREARRPPGREPFRSYSRVAAALYRLVAQTTGARVIVDSSKRPSNGALLSLIPNVTPYYLHLVRDPRAVAYSEKRPKPNPDRAWRAELPTRGTVASSVQWSVVNMASNAVLGTQPESSSMRMTYEAFVSDPGSAVRSIAQLVDEPALPWPFIDNGTVQLSGNHTVSGNPSRFAKGTVELRVDDEWTNRMSGASRILVTSLTLPWLRKYGYPIRTT
jgi:hypothetical protein